MTKDTLEKRLRTAINEGRKEAVIELASIIRGLSTVYCHTTDMKEYNTDPQYLEGKQYATELILNILKAELNVKTNREVDYEIATHKINITTKLNESKEIQEEFSLGQEGFIIEMYGTLNNLANSASIEARFTEDIIYSRGKKDRYEKINSYLPILIERMLRIGEDEFHNRLIPYEIAAILGVDSPKELPPQFLINYIPEK